MNIFYESKNKALGNLNKHNWQQKSNERAENKHNSNARSELFQLLLLYACEWLKSIVSNHNKFNKRQEWHKPSNSDWQTRYEVDGFFCIAHPNEQKTIYSSMTINNNKSAFISPDSQYFWALPLTFFAEVSRMSSCLSSYLLRTWTILNSYG